jgi:hypothetical protein
MCIRDRYYAPVIILVYGDSVLQIIKGTKWVEPGFTVTDVQDTNIPNSSVIVDDSMLCANLNTPGNYTVTYTVTNSKGLTGTATRYVQVVYLPEGEPTPPRITLLGKNPDTVIVQSSIYQDPGCTAIDNRDGDLTANVIRSGTVVLNKLGKNALVYSVSDATGNKSTATRIVWVVYDTLTTDLRVRYNVPSPDPLPSVSGTWIIENIDGAGPDASNVKSMVISWDLANKSLGIFQINYVGEPYNKSFENAVQNFAEADPGVTLTGTTIAGMETSFYITIIDEKLIWVEKSGTYALIWSKQ